MTDVDVIIIGSGMGGATLAAGLAPTGQRNLILERGDYLRSSPHDRDEQAIFVCCHYRPDEDWLDGAGATFNPGNYYCVGGRLEILWCRLVAISCAGFQPYRTYGRHHKRMAYQLRSA